MTNNITVKMGTFSSVEEILDFTIAEEEQANKFYTDLAQKMEDPAMRKVFEDFAKEELRHMAKLVAVKQGEFTIKPESVRSLGIADYVVDVEPKADMSYADALDLAVASQNEEQSDMFLNLAQEEAKHKLRLEIEYDDKVLKEWAAS